MSFIRSVAAHRRAKDEPMFVGFAMEGFPDHKVGWLVVLSKFLFIDFSFSAVHLLHFVGVGTRWC